MKETMGKKLSTQEQEIVERYYDYALSCLGDHGLDIEEYHGDICVQLCKLAQSIGIVDNMNSKYHSRIHIEVHRIVEKTIKRNVEILTSDIPDGSYNIDWDFISMADDVKKVLSTGLLEREVLVLDMYANGMSSCEISSILGVSKTRAYGILCKALRKLRHPSRCSIVKDYI